ncbi:EAL domain-containing protein [Undibacterium parvum]|uniref:EAL domain-containing protein n=1 Tax=Undibacterium piscinae TaxID=2495591 RepID=A0A6M4A5I0_9BURK|nr:EAL domain-containing protein [Undibacterium parvum]QJQ05329.1 EAL domain-containing protein [Undibacterium piscinae]
MFNSYSGVARFLGVGLMHALAVCLVLDYLTIDGNISIFWIPSGIALASVIMGGRAYLISIFFGAFAAYLWMGRSVAPALIISLVNISEAWLASWLLSRLSIHHSPFNARLTHARDYLGLLAIAMPVSVLGALLGVLCLWAVGELGADAFAISLLHWWMGSVLGVGIVTPLILVWRHHSASLFVAARAAEALFGFILSFLTGQIVFLGWWTESLEIILNPYWSFLFVAWAAARFGRHGALLMVCMSVLQALMGAIHVSGYFAKYSVQLGLMNLWLYALVLTVLGVMLALVINERRQAESLAIASEKSHRNLLDCAPDAIGVIRNSRMVYVNRAALAMFGASASEDLIGKSMLDLVHPDFHAIALARAKQIVNDGVAVPMIEERFVKLNGTPFDAEVQSTPIIFDGLASVHVIVRDVTDANWAIKNEKFRTYILELLVSDIPLHQQLEAIVLGVEQLDTTAICSVLLLDKSGLHLGQGVAPNLPDFYNQAVDGVAIGLGVGSCGTAAFTGETVIVSDIAHHPYWAPYTELAARAGLNACWSQPIRSASGSILGSFAIYHRSVNIPGEKDIALIEQCAHLASIAIERSNAEEKLSESEAHFRLLTEDVTDVVWRMDSNFIITYVSPADERLRGYPASEVIGYSLANLLTGLGSEKIAEIMQRRSAAEQAGQLLGSETFEVQQHCKHGKTIWMETTSNPERDANGKIIAYHGISRDITKRKEVELELRIAAIAFESQQGMYVADAAWVILRVNQAFTKITGYSAEDVFGQSPRMLSSGRHDEAFYDEMTEKIASCGTWQGEIWDKRKNGEIFPAWLILTAVSGEDGLISHYVATLSDMSARKAAEEQIKTLAFYDALTGLPNRRLLVNRLEQAMATVPRHQRHGALLFIDLDNFKTLNDTLGHDIGDLLLAQVAQRLNTCIRDGDTVARLGGDEFVVMLENLSEQTIDAASQVEVVGEKILHVLNQVYQLAKYEHQSTPSIGMTLFGGERENIEEPLKRADLAMYQAKAAGRNTLRFYEPQMQAVVTARMQLDADLREALSSEQFVLYYQAQVQGAALTVGAEALVRWQHPQRGMISPLEFIPFAEESGLILPLGHWVLQAACRQLAAWAQQPAMRNLSMSVNVSPRQFHQVDFVDQVLRILDDSGANPEHLKLELTEGLLVTNVEDVIAKMSALKLRGVGFSLDDFGTGYSSLAYLKRLPLDQLKIDQSFVRDILIDPNDAAIAKMVVVLADSLGLAVIAEGVETEEQRVLLASQGCHAYQGYLFSRPLPIAQFEHLVGAGAGAGANVDLSDSQFRDLILPPRQHAYPMRPGGQAG